jgi:hypothetical protein
MMGVAFLPTQTHFAVFQYPGIDKPLAPNESFTIVESFGAENSCSDSSSAVKYTFIDSGDTCSSRELLRFAPLPGS